MYECPVCGSTEFAIIPFEEIVYTNSNKIKNVFTDYACICRQCNNVVGEVLI